MRGGILGAAGLAVAGAMTARELRRRRDERAFARTLAEPGPIMELRGEPLRLPIVFPRSDGFGIIVPADLGRVTEMLPTDELHPVRLARDRAAVFVAGYRHHEASATMASGETRVARPYGEVFVTALVTRRPAPPVLPLLAPGVFGLGGFVLFLPVTTRLAMDAGRLWNLPKFVADMDFVDDDGERAVRLAEGGREILALRVRPAGRLVSDRTPTVLYSERHGRLLELPLPGVRTHRTQLGRSGGSVELGAHPVADTLRAIGLGVEPFSAITMLSTRFAMPAEREIGSARPYRGYAGVERDFGRFTVRHAGLPPIDQYVGLTSDEWTVAAVPGTVTPKPAVETRESEPTR